MKDNTIGISVGGLVPVRPPDEEGSAAPPWPLPIAAAVVVPPLPARSDGGGRVPIIATCVLAVCAMIAAVAALAMLLHQRTAPRTVGRTDDGPSSPAIATGAARPRPPAPVTASPTPVTVSPAPAPAAPPATIDRRTASNAEPEPRSSSHEPRHHADHRPVDATTRAGAASRGSEPAEPRATARPATAPAARASASAPIDETTAASAPPQPADADASSERGVEHAAPSAAAAAAAEVCDEVSCVLDPRDRPCCARFAPATRQPEPVRAKEAGVADKLDRRLIQAGMATVKPAVSGCGMRHDGKGTVRLHVRVDPSGTVSDVRVRSAPGEALAACVAAEIRKATFAKTRNGGSFGYPYIF